MEESRANRELSGRNEDGTFKKGVSGNLSGRPKGTLKQFVSERFREMTPEQKAQWLEEKKISGFDEWRMGEGNPENKTDVTSGGEVIPVLVKIINGKETKDNTNTGGIQETI